MPPKATSGTRKRERVTATDTDDTKVEEPTAVAVISGWGCTSHEAEPPRPLSFSVTCTPGGPFQIGTATASPDRAAARALIDCVRQGKADDIASLGATCDTEGRQAALEFALLHGFGSIKGAAQKKLGACVRALLALPTPLYAHRNGTAPLMLNFNCPEAVTALVESGADPLRNAIPNDSGNAEDPPDENMSHPLYYYAMFDYHQNAEALLASGRVKPDHVVPPYTQTALMRAARCGSPKMVKVLIQHGANVSAVNEDRNSVLHIAASSPIGSADVKKEILDALIAAGANRTVRNGEGKRPVDVLPKKYAPALASLLA